MQPRTSRRLGQLRGADDLLIPFGKIFVAPRRDRGFRCFCLFGHRKPKHVRERNEIASRQFGTVEALVPSADCDSTLDIRAHQSSRDERLARRLFGKAAGKLDAAHAAITRVRAISGARYVERRIENVLAMFPSGQSVINDERETRCRARRFSVGKIFAPDRTPSSHSDSCDAGFSIDPP